MDALSDAALPGACLLPCSGRDGRDVPEGPPRIGHEVPEVAEHMPPRNAAGAARHRVRRKTRGHVPLRRARRRTASRPLLRRGPSAAPRPPVHRHALHHGPEAARRLRPAGLLVFGPLRRADRGPPLRGGEALPLPDGGEPRQRVQRQLGQRGLGREPDDGEPAVGAAEDRHAGEPGQLPQPDVGEPRSHPRVRRGRAPAGPLHRGPRQQLGGGRPCRRLGPCGWIDAVRLQ
mmetsp:Transcript_54761/g.159741  ORF Transcript_54761/g.159741 Transcript_54761/m.159741 type:complete len:232 (+) Transcript_54761:241-936(+)